MLVDSIGSLGRYLRTEEETQTQRDVIETCDGDFFLVDLRPQEWEGGQDEIQDSVYEADVEGQDLDDRLREQELEGSLERGGDVGGEFAVGSVEFGVQFLVAGDFDQLFLLAVEKGRGVGLLQVEHPQTLHEHGSDGGGIEHPAPGGVLCDESAGDRADGWTKKRHERVESHCSPTLLWKPDITQYATSDSKGCTTTKTGEETEGDDFRKVVREAAGKVEDEVEEIAELQDNSPTEDFGKRTKEQWSDCKSQQERGESELEFEGWFSPQAKVDA